MKTYCAAAFTQIYADNASRYRLCCHASENPTISKYTTHNTTPFDFFRSDEMEQIRDDMLSGKEIVGCENCYKMEARGVESWRTWKYNEMYDLRSEISDVNLKLRVMGSYCNLGCYMCYPYNSSTRRMELKQNDIDWTEFDAGVSPLGKKSYEDTVENILENIEYVERFNITGGEPLQLDRMWQLMERIPEEHAKNITLTFDTNLTKLEYKQWNIWQLIDKFKDVRLGVSVDHFGEKLRWIRYPIDVKEFEENLHKVKDYISNLNITVSMLNVWDLHDIKEYYSDFKTTMVGVVIQPDILSVKNLPHKEKLLRLCKDFPMVVQELTKEADPVQLMKGIEYCKKLNSQRNLNFEGIFEDFFHQIN